MKEATQLTTNEAILLQQVHEDGEDDTSTLADQLGMSRHHIIAMIERLKHKGLIAINSDFGDLWIHLTRKGQQLMYDLWPEANAKLASA